MTFSDALYDVGERGAHQQTGAPAMIRGIGGVGGLGGVGLEEAALFALLLVAVAVVVWRRL
jgi:hypothetical protein